MELSWEMIANANANMSIMVIIVKIAIVCYHLGAIYFINGMGFFTVIVPALVH